MWAREREMIAKEDRVNLCSRAFVSNFYVRERTTLFKQLVLMLVHLSTSSWHASSLSTIASSLLVLHQRSLVIHRTKLEIDVASLTRDSMSTTLFVEREFRLLRSARFVHCVREDFEIEIDDRQRASERSSYANLCSNLRHCWRRRSHRD